jgi:hypothetical protein
VLSVRQHTTNSRERLDDSLNEFCHLENRSLNKSSIENFNVAKSYIEGRLHVLIFFRIAGESQEYVAILRNRQRINERNHNVFFFGGRGTAKEFGTNGFGHVRLADSILYAFDTVRMCKDQGVLIRDVHSVQPPESIIPTEIRFEHSNLLLVNDTHANYFSRRTGLVNGFALSNREICLRGNLSSTVDNETCGQVVQGCSEIVNNIANNETNDRINLRNTLDYVIGVGRLKVVLGANFTWLCCEKNISPRIEFSDVVFGPIDL